MYVVYYAYILPLQQHTVYVVYYVYILPLQQHTVYVVHYVYILQSNRGTETGSDRERYRETLAAQYVYYSTYYLCSILYIHCVYIMYILLQQLIVHREGAGIGSCCH